MVKMQQFTSKVKVQAEMYQMGLKCFYTWKRFLISTTNEVKKLTVATFFLFYNYVQRIVIVSKKMEDYNKYLSL